MDERTKNIENLEKELLNRTITLKVIESGLFAVIILVAFLGNLLVCRAVYRSPRLRTIANYSVILLALSDISMSLTVFPLILAVAIEGEIVFTKLVCQVEAYMAIALVYTSVLTVTFMAVNRYVKIVKTNLYRGIFTRTKTLLMFVVLLIVAWLGPMIPLLQGKEFSFHPGKMVCLYSYKDMGISHFVLSVFFYFTVPYVITIFCYWKIFRTVRQHNSTLANSRANSSSTNHGGAVLNRREINITKTLIAIFLVFTFCMMQLAVIDYIEFFGGEYTLHRQTYVLYTIMCTLASAANPVIYGLMNPVFRSEYKRTLCCKSRVITVAPISEPT